MPSNYEFGYIDYCITQLSAVEDAFNIYRETGSLDALNRLNANAESKTFLQKWLDLAKLPETDRVLAQLQSDSFNKSRLSPYADIMLHCQKDWRNPLDLIHIIYVYRGSFHCQMKNRSADADHWKVLHVQCEYQQADQPLRQQRPIAQLSHFPELSGGHPAQAV